jgi:predicted RNA-binding Zn ribbon-like protein
MDEFARLMNMEGVRPLDQARERLGRSAKQSRQDSTPAVVAAQELDSHGHAWVTGSRARTALETALERLATEIREGRRGWATGIRQNGMTVTLSASSGAASLLAAADRESLRLMIVGGDGWTFVMHPLMGVATLDEDPAGSE